MVFTDIQNLLQLAKERTALARVPSFNIQSPRLDKLSSSVMETYNKRREYGKKLAGQLKQLQNDYFGASDSARIDLYDRVVKISQDITTSISSEKRKYSHRYVKSLCSLLSSREYLISPRTRFSLIWRMIVTNCLLIEIARLCLSWRLSETFGIPLSQIVGRLFVYCKEPEQVKDHVAFIADQVNAFRRHIFEIIPIGPPPVEIEVCIPNGPQALLILQLGKMLEWFVDGVVFLDIFVWFFTGDIDIDTHTVIPKPFFTRCILPGTLVQVLDHPTLPDLLPGLIKSILMAFAIIGYSRCIRWSLAMIPAVKMLVFDPLVGFFFQHIEEDEGLMYLAQSAGMLTPERKSGFLFGSTGSLTGFIGTSERHLLRKGSIDASNTSQVGLSFDASPVPSRYDIQSMISTEGSDDTLGEIERIPPCPLPPPLSARVSIENNNSSPLRKQKSVHFGLFEDTNQKHSSRDGLSKSDVGYSLSSHHLHSD